MTSADDFSVAFHVGAHKTATSHLQWSLRDASAALADRGVRYYGPAHFRLPGRSIQRLFGLRGKPHKQQRSPQDQLALLRKSAQRLVLSEENYIGVLNSPRPKTVKLRYPEAATRVNALARAMDAGQIDVFLGIRNPATFLASAYSQMLLGGRLMTFDQFLELSPINSVNWFSLVKRFSRAAGVRSVTVWQYEDYEALFYQICSAMVGADAADVVKPINERVHPGFSRAAVDHILSQKGADDAAALTQAARSQYPTGKEYAAFDGFNAADHARAAEVYAKQIAGIQALPKVTLLQP